MRTDRLKASLGALCAVLMLAASVPAQEKEQVKLVDTAPAVGQAPTAKLPPVAEKRLPNGMRVIVVENHEQPVVTMSLMIRSGATSEPAEKAGLAQLTAGLVDQGTTTRSAQQIAETIDSAGGSLSVNASWDSTIASTTVLANRTGVAAELLSDVLRNPTFKDEEIERVRTQTLNALKLNLSDAGAVADQVFESVVYGGTPYGHPIEGTADTVRGIKRDDLVAFHKEHYIPNNATLAVVGDIKAKEAFALAEQQFAGWEKGAEPAEVKPVEMQPGQLRIIVLDKPDAEQTEIRAGLAGFPRADSDYFPGLVANAILGGAPFSSRIESELRVKRGLTYGARSNFDARRQAGAFEIDTNTKVATTAEAVGVILDQIAMFRNTGADEKDLEQRKKFLTGVFLLSLETPAGVASRLLQAELYGLGSDYVESFTKNVQAVTPADVRRVAQARIVPGHMLIVLAGKASAFADEIKKYGPVETIPFNEVDFTAPTLRREKPAAPAAAGPVSEGNAKAGAELAQKTIAALGGKAWQEQKTLVATGSGTITPQPGQSLPVQSFTTTVMFPDKNRADLNLGFLTVSQGSNGTMAWVEQGGNVQDITDQAKESRQYGLDVLREFGKDGYTARAMPDAEVDGKPVKVFALTDPEGHESVFMVDATTYLPVEVSYTNSQGKQEEIYGDFREVSGVKVPFSFELKRDGNSFLTITYTEAQVNVDVNQKMFEKPGQ